MSFTTSEEVHQYLGGVWDLAFADPEIGAKLTETGLVLTFEYSDPDTVMTLESDEQKVVPGQGDRKAAATMSMAADVANRYWQGKVNLPIAMARGQIKVSGNVASLLKLAPLGKKLFPLYAEMLRADGRTDLLV
jgi:putative sterol carrier protein